MAVEDAGIVRMGMIRRLPALTPAEFTEHWRGPHGQFGARILNLRRYHQNHTIQSLPLGRLADRWMLDGLSQLWFDSIEVMTQSIASPSYATLASDTPTVMTMPGLIAGTPERVAGLAPGTASLHKAMVVIGRKDDVSSEAFLAGWRDLSAGLRKAPGLAGLTNTVVSHRESEPGKPVAYQALPVDVVAEVWFDTGQALNAFFAAPGLAAEVERLADNAGVYAVQTYVIVP
ncbi:MAG: EthD family reductase [Bauldia sp.]